MTRLLKAMLAAGVGLVQLLPVGTAEAAAVSTEFAGTQTCLPLNPTQPGVFTVLPSGNIRMRGLITACNNSSPQGSSFTLTSANGNVDPNGFGPIFGTFTQFDKPGGVEEFAGSWQGQATPAGDVVRGTGAGLNAFDGMRIFFEVQPTSPGSPSVLTGRILDPHGTR